MRKIFTLFAATLIAFAASAAIVNITAETAGSLASAVSAANPGDTIVLASGTYVEANQIQFTKAVTVMAAEGAQPVISHQWYSSLTENADVTLIGLKFDGSLYPVSSGNPQCLRPYDNTTGKQLHLENCEFTGYPGNIIYANNGSRILDTITINNCYFHDNVKAAIYLVKSGTDTPVCKGIIVSNSTFANFTGLERPLFDIRNHNEENDTDVKILVDHCTFYNFIGSDYAAVSSRNSTDVVISNSIFAEPNATAQYATKLYGGNINNVLTYNLTKGKNASGHNQSSGAPAISDTIVADPLFVDAANADYTLGEGSPALGAGTDGSNLGDPRWWPAAPIEYRRIFCHLNAGWWRYDANGQPTNTVGAYAWSDGLAANAEWPGVMMTEVEGETDTWYIDIDNRYTSVIFTRVGPDGGYQGIQTQNLVIPTDDSAMYTITKDSYDWEHYTDGKLDPSEGAWSVFTPTQTVTLADGYYLMGVINGVAPQGDWDISAINPEYLLTQNPANDAEYMITVTLAENDQFQVVGVENGAIGPWLPGGENANYQVDANHAGLKTIYCRPDRQGAADWWKNCIYVAPNDATNLSNFSTASEPTKFMLNGRLYIILNGVRYNALGQQE